MTQNQAFGLLFHQPEQPHKQYQTYYFQCEKMTREEHCDLSVRDEEEGEEEEECY